MGLRGAALEQYTKTQYEMRIEREKELKEQRQWIIERLKDKFGASVILSSNIREKKEVVMVDGVEFYCEVNQAGKYTLVMLSGASRIPNPTLYDVGKVMSINRHF